MARSRRLGSSPSGSERVFGISGRIVRFAKPWSLRFRQVELRELNMTASHPADPDPPWVPEFGDAPTSHIASAAILD